MSSFKLSRGIGRLRGLALVVIPLALAACETSNSIDPSAGSPPETIPEPLPEAPSPEAPSPETPSPEPPSPEPPSPAPPPTTVAEGIPMGLFHLTNDVFDTRYTGALRTVNPLTLMGDLAAIKARGGRVILNLSGSQRHYKGDEGHFSLTKWQARIDRYRNLDLTPYINDGTIVGHYLIDEPYDAHNFAGQAVTGVTVEEMAKYSKGIWPDVPTIVRAEPYLLKWNGPYHYLDAAWSQYLLRKGDIKDYIAKNVDFARNMGLALVVGLNLRDGGVGNSTMTASEILSWGSTLLGGTDPCAFISWKYDATYLARPDVHQAMQSLSDLARNRPRKACRKG